MFRGRSLCRSTNCRTSASATAALDECVSTTGAPRAALIYGASHAVREERAAEVGSRAPAVQPQDGAIQQRGRAGGQPDARSVWDPGSRVVAGSVADQQQGLHTRAPQPEV